MKTMKKMVMMMITAIMILSLCACNTNISPKEGNSEKEYVALEIGISDCFDNGIHQDEYPIWSVENLNSHDDPNAPREITVTFMGKTYTGEYLRSLVRDPNLYLSHRYESDVGYFEINDTTGQVVKFMFTDKPELPEFSTIQESDCQNIINDIVDDYIDPNGYECEVSVDPRGSNYYYSCRYYREFDGCKTNDEIFVKVDGNGHIHHVNMRMLGSFDGVEEIELDKQKAESAIYEKLDTIYKNNPHKRTSELKYVTLITLEDGSPAYYYYTENHFEYDEGDKTVTYGSGIYFVATEK